MSEYCCYCEGYDDDMEFCSNHNCNNYMCLPCSVETFDTNIICHECSVECDLCKCILNIEDTDLYIIINCSKCSHITSHYCNSCNKKYHIQKCRNTYCLPCMPKCSNCGRLCCCKYEFHPSTYNDGYCKRCFQIKYYELKKDMIYNVLKEFKFHKYLIDIIIHYYL